MIQNHCRNLAILCLFFIVACAASTKMWQADRMVNSGKYREAIAMYSQIMESNPDTETAREAHLKAGKVYYKHLDETEKALKIFEKIVVDYPRSKQAGESLWLLGMHYYNIGEYQQARNKFIQLILDFPNISRTKAAKLQIAACYEKLNKYQDAISTYTEFEKFYPKDSKIPEIVLKKGQLYEQLGQKDKAVLEYQRLVNEFSSFQSEVDKARQRLKTLGAASLITESENSSGGEQGGLREVGPRTRPNARAELESWKPSPTFGYNPRDLLIGRDLPAPRLPVWSTQTGPSRQAGGNALFGGMELEESLNSDGALLDDAVYNMGLMYYMTGDYKKAGACLEKAVELGIEEADAYLKLGVSYREVGALYKAKKAFKTAAKLDQTVIENLILNNENRASKGDYEKAISSLELILGISSYLDKQIYTILSTIYQNMGDAQKAAEYKKLAGG